MLHPPAEHIELYVLGGEPAHSERAEFIRAHLLECPGCKSYADYLTLFYKEVFQLWSPQNGADDVGDETRRRRRPLVLHPFRVVDVYDGQGFPGLMAAKSNADHTALRLLPLASFAQQDEDALLRFVLDRSAQTVQVTLRLAFPGPNEGMLVSIPALEKHLLLDAVGDASFPFREWPAGTEWLRAAVLVRSPVATILLTRGNSPQQPFPQTFDRTLSGDLDGQVSYDGQVLSLALERKGQKDLPAFIAYSLPGQFARLVPLLDGKVRISLLPQEVPASFSAYL